MTEPIGYLSNVEFMEEFFKRVQKLPIDNRETRTQLLEDMVKEAKAIRMTETDLKRYIKGKKVLVVKKEKNG